MKKLLHQTMVYRYFSIKEAEKHIEEMIKDGWKASINSVHHDNQYVCETEHKTHPYLVEFYKWLVD